MSVLLLDRVTRRFAASEPAAVDQLTLAVEEGEVVALVGPSGCGKSTTLRLVSGLEQPDGGRVLLDGVDASRRPVERRNVGYVPQSYALFPHLDVAANVGFGLRARRVARDERRQLVEAALRLTRIEKLADRFPAELSGGQCQRVALARALAIEPRVLLLDEPLAALDPQLRADLRRQLADTVRASGRATLFVTHDQSEALALADRVAVLRDGRLLQCATPNDLWRHPADPFVADFVAKATVFEGVVHDDGGVIVHGTWTITAASLDGPTPPFGGAVEVVLRPSDVEPVAAGDPRAVAFHVEHFEFQGDRTRASGTLAGRKFTADLDPAGPLGPLIWLGIKPGRASVQHGPSEPLVSILD